MVVGGVSELVRFEEELLGMKNDVGKLELLTVV